MDRQRKCHRSGQRECLQIGLTEKLQTKWKCLRNGKSLIAHNSTCKKKLFNCLHFNGISMFIGNLSACPFHRHPINFSDTWSVHPFPRHFLYSSTWSIDKCAKANSVFTLIQIQQVGSFLCWNVESTSINKEYSESQSLKMIYIVEILFVNPF